MITQRKAYEEAVRRHLENCQNKLHSAGQTNQAQAEHAIEQFYLRVKKRKPNLIFWCQSPYQMAVLPSLIASILESNEWKLLKSNLSTSTPGSYKWETTWNAEWHRLEADLSELFKNVMVHNRDLVTRKNIYENAAKRLEKLLHDACLHNKLEPGLVKFKRSNNDPENYRRIKSDTDLHRFIIATQIGMEKAAGIPIAQHIGQDGSPDDQSIVISSAAIGLIHGIWDSRFLSEILPVPSLAPQVKSLRQETAQVRALFAEFERSAGLMSNWFRRLPPRKTIFSPGDFENCLHEFERHNDKPTFDRYMGYLHAGIEGYREIKKTIQEEIGLRNYGTIWIPAYLPWIPFALACRFIKADFFGKLQNDIDCLAALYHGAAGYFFCDKICFVCESPAYLKVNAAGRPHSEDGPAAAWSDGFEVYSWRGLPMAQDLLERRDALSVAEIRKENNLELKRIMIDLYGESRFLMDAGAKVIHKDEFGTLYRAEIIYEEPLVMVKVRNSTREPDGSFKYYFLRVPPTTMRAKQAVAWTFGIEENDYHPSFQS